MVDILGRCVCVSLSHICKCVSEPLALFVQLTNLLGCQLLGSDHFPVPDVFCQVNVAASLDCTSPSQSKISSETLRSVPPPPEHKIKRNQTKDLKVITSTGFCSVTVGLDGVLACGRQLRVGRAAPKDVRQTEETIVYVVANARTVQRFETVCICAPRGPLIYAGN